MGVRASQALPWKQLATAAVCAAVAVGPGASRLPRRRTLPPLVALILGALTYGLTLRGAVLHRRPPDAHRRFSTARQRI